KKLKEEKIIELKEKEEERANKEKDWAFEWLCEIFEQENIQLTPELKNRISEALNSIAAYEKERRTITQFQIQLQDNILRTAIKPYTKDGAFGRYFDSNNDSFTPEYSWQVFEMEKIMESKTACPPMLKYIFHKLEVEMFADGKPTILILDECWSFLSNKSFAEKIKEWLKVLRKKNVSVVFATQELTDVLNSEIKDSLLNSCPSTIYLANSKATTSNYRKIYNSLGLNDTQILNIANLEERRDYYLVSTVGNLDFRPAFSQFELAFIGASSIEDQNKCIEIEAELRKNDISKEVFEEEFYKRWKEYKGLEEEI
ncbi:MAG: conjugal transfer protein TrbE, partial [Fusobacterium sp.]|nr:conjugal transfer protein TrbE [Fusobacterium sp.]